MVPLNALKMAYNAVFDKKKRTRHCAQSSLLSIKIFSFVKTYSKNNKGMNLMLGDIRGKHTVKYHQHGTLIKNLNHKKIDECWTFETSELSVEHEGIDLIDLLDDLSREGFELVSGHDGEYILRTKEEIEYEEEYHYAEEPDWDQTVAP